MKNLTCVAVFLAALTWSCIAPASMASPGLGSSSAAQAVLQQPIMTACNPISSYETQKSCFPDSNFTTRMLKQETVPTTSISFESDQFSPLQCLRAQANVILTLQTHGCSYKIGLKDPAEAAAIQALLFSSNAMIIVQTPRGGANCAMIDDATYDHEPTLNVCEAEIRSITNSR